MKNVKVISKIKNKKEDDNRFDFGIFITLIILLCIGIVMVASASSYYALTNYKNSNYFLIRQLMFGVVGFAAMIIISKIDYKKYLKWSYIIYGIALILLVAVLIPHVGQTRNGATRWLGFGSLVFQPSEIMKIALVIAMSAYLSLNYKKLNNLRGYLVPFLMLVAVIVVMFLQKHLSGTIVMIVAAFSILFASGMKVKLRYILIGGAFMVVVLGVFILMPDKDASGEKSFRLARIVSFLNPEEDIKGGNWQAAQSLYAIGSGGLFGRGLGQSRQKYLWLPEAQNDFIFAVIGEELGLIGTVSILLLFTFFIYRGYRIALTARDMFGSLLATGITSAFALQILVNIAVVTCTVPVTGMPLPFFSYGGTALFINLCAMGIVLNVSRYCKKG